MKDMHDKVENLDRDLQLLVQRNQQIRSLERDLVTKEETIHKILADKDQSILLANQVGGHNTCGRGGRGEGERITCCPIHSILRQ